MIRKLRRKFVLICMAMVTAVLAVVFVSVYLSAQRSIQQSSEAVLERVIQEAGSSGSFRPGLSFNAGNIQLPYFTVRLVGNNAYVTSGTYSDLENTETLKAILTTCIELEADAGVLEQYGMRYLRQSNGMLTQLAFVDMSMEEATLRNMMGAYLQIGALALALLLGVSVLLSFWATRPVEKAWQQQRQFLSDASHELKTPLTVILSNAELMESAALEEKPARWADNIHSEARRMRSLVEEMLTLARGDNMVRTAVLSDVCLSEVAMDCVLLFEPVAFEAGKPLEYTIRKDVNVLGDPDGLKQIISVLLDNAIKYSCPGGIIRLTLDQNERNVRLQVSNDHGGNPIPADVLPHLFQRFYRADTSRGEQSGFGLGLSIAAAMTEELKGTIKAESDGESTRFILTLPLRK